MSEAGQSGRGLLISGTSHCGKSTLAASLAERTGSAVLSTDEMARHPGRPWPTPRAHVVEYYTDLSDETRLTLLQHHYQAMRGTIRLEIAAVAAKGAFIVEGSALRAEDHEIYGAMGCEMICLFAPPAALTARILSACGSVDGTVAICVAAFVRRSIADQRTHLAKARDAGVRCVDTTDADAMRQLSEWSLDYLSAR